MAKFEIFAVRDQAVGAFMQPFFARSKGEALRSFSDAVADPKMEFGKHPADYSLWTFGSWDDEGTFSLDETRFCILQAVDCMPVVS